MQDSNSTNQRPMGFAGLASMVSDVDDIVVEEVGKFEKTAAAKPTPAAETPTPSYVPSAAETPQNNAFEANRSGKPDKTGRNWIIAIAVVAAIVWLINQSNHSPSTYEAPSYNTAANDTPANSTSPQPSDTSVQQPQTALEVDEVPPVGTNVVLTRAQLHYCFAENIRLEAARDVLNPQRQSDTTRFNNLVSDYNARCSRYRYHQRDYDGANRDVQERLYQYQSEGRLRFTNN